MFPRRFQTPLSGHLKTVLNCSNNLKQIRLQSPHFFKYGAPIFFPSLSVLSLFIGDLLCPDSTSISLYVFICCPPPLLFQSAPKPRASTRPPPPKKQYSNGACHCAPNNRDATWPVHGAALTISFTSLHQHRFLSEPCSILHSCVPGHCRPCSAHSGISTPALPFPADNNFAFSPFFHCKTLQKCFLLIFLFSLAMLVSWHRSLRLPCLSVKII